MTCWYLQTAHCVDYLRQVLMCHGDLTPITLTYNHKSEFVDPNFRIKHTCRNFDRIWNFAAKRNRSGISIEGWWPLISFFMFFAFCSYNKGRMWIVPCMEFLSNSSPWICIFALLVENNKIDSVVWKWQHHCAPHVECIPMAAKVFCVSFSWPWLRQAHWSVNTTFGMAISSCITQNVSQNSLLIPKTICQTSS